MNIKSTAIALTLVAASAVSAPVSAQEDQVKQILNNMVSQALNVASSEIENTIDKSVITAGHMLSLNTEEKKGEVIITDIVKADEVEDKN
jgi:hypothetical protein